MTLATDSRRDGVPRRVRSSLWLRVAAIPRNVESAPDGGRAQQLHHRTEARNHGAVKQPQRTGKVLAAVT